MRVARVTHQPSINVWRSPYRRTLYEFFLIEQEDRVADVRERGFDLHRAGLHAMAFHEPKRLNEEHKRLLAELRPSQPLSSEADSLAFLREIVAADRAGAWKEMIQ